MIALFSLLVIVLLSIIAVRIGSIALELTGLSSEVASFQAQSAFSGVGFTTAESEAIVSHFLRRRIIRILILFGGAGITTSMATLVLTFVGQSGQDVAMRAEFLLLGLLVIFLMARSKHLYEFMRIVITKALEKFTRLHIYDYERLFGLEQGYAITKIIVKADSWFRDKRIKDLKLELEGILILAIYRRYKRTIKLIGAPHGDEVLKAGDELICYAKEEAVDDLFLQKQKLAPEEPKEA
ncbi:MAG: potassium transporter TrkA [Candidatus Omnitrophica bacterium CG12_big_fil_rev_8_21_14_0_65_43_15]|uniref:Potassium transporter TrkA n=1 Tax=Candidatus Taenaricola geysiri TaxID=1974752 RepID=A0A2J0LKJ8_9BACT|nr:MAG: potassium transporter TrkA [Candidatus Omnitrophica bacterium CG12_big_fil_rev_8_21_14_0_65_43_15]PIY84333.1 MAG: potassium transporter TrkA [Candidatus Omnitrophica bacterium CG_4_10_14_0_8_um_filter_43_18]